MTIRRDHIAGMMLIMFGALKAVGRLRVNPKADEDGNSIDNWEHGQSIWPDILPLPGDLPESLPGIVKGGAPAVGD